MGQTVEFDKASSLSVSTIFLLISVISIISLSLWTIIIVLTHRAKEGLGPNLMFTVKLLLV